MNRYVIIDSRIREIEQKYIENLGYSVVKIIPNLAVYPEISSHTDIFCCKIKNELILEENLYNSYINSNLYKELFEKIHVIKTNTNITKNSTAYNVCVTSKYAIHNFKYTDDSILDCIEKAGLQKINVKQSYTKCNISIVNDNSIITCDKGIANELKKYSDIDLLYINSNDINIKLKNEKGYSSMSGFIGGATCVLDDKFILFGDSNNINEIARDKIIKFIENKDLKFIDFKGLDIIDYGGIVEI